MLSERAGLVLKRLIKRYIADGHAVASKALSGPDGLPLSPATIRNVLAELEAEGYLSSPHTSAGRIPTEMGLRYFVDGLLHSRPISHEVLSPTLAFDRNSSRNDVLTSASGLLSDLSKWVGVVSTPKTEKMILRHVEFLPLPGKRVLVILVVNEQDVQNRIIQTRQEYTPVDLRQTGQFLTEHFEGKDLSSARQELLRALHAERHSVDRLMRTACDLADEAFSMEEKGDVLVAGEANLFAIDGTGMAINELQQVFQAFREKQQMLHLLDACISTDGVNIFIGEESGQHALKQCSVITARYMIDEATVGVLGVVGPTRMRYDMVIPIVENTAKLLTYALKKEE